MENQVPPGTPPPLPPSQPPIFVAAPPVPRRGGRGWMILSVVLLVILAAVVAGRITMFVTRASRNITGMQSGRQFEEVTLENPNESDKIAVVPVEGMITGEWDPTGHSMVDAIADELRLAGKDDAVKAVILKVDSPGGEVMASDDIARAISDFQDKYKKPVVAAMGGLAASGGYYVSVPCQWIVANELTITGSIGVILSTYNYRGLMDKVGLKPVVFKSGKFKDMLRGSKEPDEIDPAEQKMIQDMIMQTYDKFKSVVQAGRDRAAAKNNGKGRKLVANWQQYADGRILTGTNAYELGFVDQLGNFQTAVDTTRRLANISGKARLIRYEEPFSLAHLLGLSASAQTKGEKVVKIDLGINLPKLQAGRPYFLCPTVAH